VLAGGGSVGVVDVGEESTNTRDANRSRKVCSSCLTVSPSVVRMSPIEVVEGVAYNVTDGHVAIIDIRLPLRLAHIRIREPTP